MINAQTDLGGFPTADAATSPRLRCQRARRPVPRHPAERHVVREPQHVEGPFNNLDMRKAVNFAVDRTALAPTWRLGATPTDQIFTPGIPGYYDADIYPLDRPDYRQGTALVGSSCGTTGEALDVQYGFGTGSDGSRERPRADRLHRRGTPLDRVVETTEAGEAGGRLRPADQRLGSGLSRTPRLPGQLLNGNFIKAANNVNLSYFNDPIMNAKLAQANLLTWAWAVPDLRRPRRRAHARLRADCPRRQYERAHLQLVARERLCLRARLRSRPEHLPHQVALSRFAGVEALLAVARDAIGRRAGPARDDLAQLGADVVEPDAVVGCDAFREPAVDKLAKARPAELLAVVVRTALPARKPSPSRSPSSCGPNESVTKASNQQTIPALTPKSSTPASQASRRIASKPWTRQIASMFAALPPPTETRPGTARARADRRAATGRSAGARARRGPRTARRSERGRSASSPTAVGTWRTRGRSFPVSDTACRSSAAVCSGGSGVPPIPKICRVTSYAAARTAAS